jgi:hypothetical protein
MIPLDDESLFGNDAGEDEDESVLMSYFVDRADFSRFLDASKSFRIAKGRKGIGKSALLVRFAHEQRAEQGQPSPIVLQLVPSKLMALKDPPAAENHHVLVNYWKQVICGAINMQLAKDIGFAWKDDHIALVENAEIAGFQGRSLISSLLARVAAKIKVGAVELTPAPRPIADNEELLGRVRQESSLRRPVWFLLDDIDAKFQNTPTQQAFISSFFSACRYLANELEDVGIRATVRTDVWASLNGAEDLDKCDQYLTDITWSASQLESILTHRILAYVKRSFPAAEAASWTVADHAEKILNLVFVPRMRWGYASVPAAHVLRILAGGRPRWIAQLCRMAGEYAARERQERITRHHVNLSMPLFGQRRLADLYKEHQYQFADLKALLESFSGGPSNYSTAALLHRIADKYLSRGRSSHVPPIDGVEYFNDLQLARFLFKIGFVNGSDADYQRRGGPQFLSFEERADLLEVDTNLDDGMSWEVHPAYRNALRIKAGPKDSLDVSAGG